MRSTRPVPGSGTKGVSVAPSGGGLVSTGGVVVHTAGDPRPAAAGPSVMGTKVFCPVFARLRCGREATGGEEEGEELRERGSSSGSENLARRCCKVPSVSESSGTPVPGPEEEDEEEEEVVEEEVRVEEEFAEEETALGVGTP